MRTRPVPWVSSRYDKQVQLHSYSWLGHRLDWDCRAQSCRERRLNITRQQGMVEVPRCGEHWRGRCKRGEDIGWHNNRIVTRIIAHANGSPRFSLRNQSYTRSPTACGLVKEGQLHYRGPRSSQVARNTWCGRQLREGGTAKGDACVIRF